MNLEMNEEAKGNTNKWTAQIVSREDKMDETETEF